MNKNFNEKFWCHWKRRLTPALFLRKEIQRPRFGFSQANVKASIELNGIEWSCNSQPMIEQWAAASAVLIQVEN